MTNAQSTANKPMFNVILRRYVIPIEHLVLSID